MRDDPQTANDSRHVCRGELVQNDGTLGPVGDALSAALPAPPSGGSDGEFGTATRPLVPAGWFNTGVLDVEENITADTYDFVPVAALVAAEVDTTGDGSYAWSAALGAYITNDPAAVGVPDAIGVFAVVEPQGAVDGYYAGIFAMVKPKAGATIGDARGIDAQVKITQPGVVIGSGSRAIGVIGAVSAFQGDIAQIIGVAGEPYLGDAADVHVDEIFSFYAHTGGAGGTAADLAAALHIEAVTSHATTRWAIHDISGANSLFSGDIQHAAAKGPVLVAPNASLHRLKVANDGTLSTEAA